jgi:CheY-like chemotaxis protein
LAPKRETIRSFDDNAANSALMRYVMAARPAITFLGADGGRAGGAMAQKRLPNLVLLDYHLPDMNGDQVLKLLLADPRTAKIPVVMLSGDATSTQISRLLAMGASGYVTKPFKVQALLASVDSFVGATSA